MDGLTVPAAHGAARVSGLLDSPEIAEFISTLDATRETGRPGYGARALVGLALVKSVYNFATWTRAVRLVGEHDALRAVLGSAPSVSAAYRFAVKLRQHEDMLTACAERVLAGLREHRAGMGETVAIDGSDLPAYGNGQRHLFNGGPEREHFADPDAMWGHRSAISTRKGGGFYGFKLDAAVCTTTGLPVAWEVRSANAAETPEVPGLLDTIRARGFAPGVAVLDKGYDQTSVYDACEDRDIRPVVPLRKTPSVVAGKHLPPACEHGTWTFAGSDTKRGASKWRCPTGECTPASRWIKADRLHTLIPRKTDRWKTIYKTRGAVEREFGRLKHEFAMLPLRVRGLAKVRLHVNLSILVQLGPALLNARTAAVT